MHTHARAHTHTHTHTHIQSLSHVRPFVTPWTVAHQAPLSMGFPSKNTGVGCHFLLQGTFLTQGSNLRLLPLVLGRWILYHGATRKALSSLSGMGRIEEWRGGKGSNWCLSAMRTVSSLMGVPSLISHAACSSPWVKETYHPQDGHVTCFSSRFQE